MHFPPSTGRLRDGLGGAAGVAVGELEGVGHQGADVGEPEEHQGDPDHGVQDRQHLPPGRSGGCVPIACKTRGLQPSTFVHAIVIPNHPFCKFQMGD